MPRARNIKPAFFENEHLGGLSGDIQLLFIGLWTQADREGVIEYRPAKLRKALFGFRNDITDEVFNGYITVLTRLDNGRMLVIREYDNIEYLIVINFETHQNPHHTEKKGKLPSRKALLSRGATNLTVKEPLSNGEAPCHNALIPDSCILIPDCGEGESIGTEVPPPPKNNVKKIGTRLKEDWWLEGECEEWGDWAMKEFGWDEDKVISVAHKFKDHWLGKSGKDATKIDWQATWRNWCRREQEGF